MQRTVRSVSENNIASVQLMQVFIAIGVGAGRLRRQRMRPGVAIFVGLKPRVVRCAIR